VILTGLFDVLGHAEMRGVFSTPPRASSSPSPRIQRRLEVAQLSVLAVEGDVPVAAGVGGVEEEAFPPPCMFSTALVTGASGTSAKVARRRPRLTESTLPWTFKSKVVGRNLRSRRKAQNLSQVDFAHAIDVHLTYLGDVERGEGRSRSNALGGWQWSLAPPRPAASGKLLIKSEIDLSMSNLVDPQRGSLAPQIAALALT